MVYLKINFGLHKQISPKAGTIIHARPTFSDAFVTAALLGIGGATSQTHGQYVDTLKFLLIHKGHCSEDSKFFQFFYSCLQNDNFPQFSFM